MIIDVAPALAARPFHLKAVTSLAPRLKHIDYSLYDGAVSYWKQRPRFANNN